MKLYDLIHSLLVSHSEYRDSDRKLAWAIWEKQEIAGSFITKENFIKKAEHFETIRRTRQKVVEQHPELQASSDVKAMRDEIESQKGTFVYREEIKVPGPDLTPYMEELKKMKDISQDQMRLI